MYVYGYAPNLWDKLPIAIVFSIESFTTAIIQLYIDAISDDVYIYTQLVSSSKQPLKFQLMIA